MKKSFFFLTILTLVFTTDLAFSAPAVRCEQAFFLPISSQESLTNKAYSAATKSFQTLSKAHSYKRYEAEKIFSEKFNYKESKPSTSLKDGTIVEGSINHNGLQPHYRINLSDPRLTPLLEFARNLKNSPEHELQKVDQLRTYVQSLLPNRSYNSLAYHRVLRKFRKLGLPIELGDYIEAKSGVCREHALLMHFALQEAGLNPKFQYWNTWRRFSKSIIYEDHAANTININGEPIVVDSYFNYYNGKKLSDLRGLDPTLSNDPGGIIQNSSYPRVFIPNGKKSEMQFSLNLSKDRETQFNIYARSAAERIFKEQQDLYDQAASDDLVPIEWLYFPFYVPFGHAGLRVGESVFEFTSKGWKSHDNGQDSARGFIFNNPLFKKRFEHYQELRLPSYSIGVTLQVKKSDVENLISRIKNEDSGEFSMFCNNCNQQLIEKTKNVISIAENENPYLKFSTVLTFKKILENRELREQQVAIYPLPGAEKSVVSYQEQFPRYFYEEHGGASELSRTILHKLYQIAHPEKDFFN